MERQSRGTDKQNIEGMHHALEQRSLGRLTPREKEMLSLRCIYGKSVKEIASEMGCSPNTIKAFMTQVFRKSGAESSAEICTIVGYQLGLSDRVEAMRPYDV